MELILFAKQLSDKNAQKYSEGITNHAVSRAAERTPERVVQTLLGVQAKQISGTKSLKLLTNDRVTPTSQLFQCEVYTKSSGFLATQKKLWFHVGSSQILVTRYYYFSK